MKNETKIDLGLTGYNELFMSTEERLDMKKPKVEDIPLYQLTEFENHPFKVLDNEEMENLKQSILSAGIISPALARPKGDGYELISGHRRLAACRELGLKTMPVLIRDMNDDEAVIAMVDSNLQREHILPSEKAFAYKMKMEALKHQGRRTDLTSRQLVGKSESADLVSTDESGRTVQRYVRLTYLIPELLHWIDDGRIAMSVGVELSFLSEDAQRGVFEECERNDCTPSYSQAFQMRKLYNDGRLSSYDVSRMLSQEKPNQRETLKIPMDKLRDRLPQNLSVSQQEDFILKAVDYYKKYLQRQRENSR